MWDHRVFSHSLPLQKSELDHIWFKRWLPKVRARGFLEEGVYKWTDVKVRKQLIATEKKIFWQEYGREPEVMVMEVHSLGRHIDISTLDKAIKIEVTGVQSAGVKACLLLRSRFIILSDRSDPGMAVRCLFPSAAHSSCYTRASRSVFSLTSRSASFCANLAGLRPLVLMFDIS